MYIIISFLIGKDTTYFRNKKVFLRFVGSIQNKSLPMLTMICLLASYV